MYLVLLETAGNQKYIFSTNKLKENIGASELTYRSGTQWVLDAVSNITGNSRLGLWRGSQQLRQTLLSPTLNPPIEQSDTHQVEIILAASGKALLITRTAAVARQIIQQVTRRALIDAPGLDITGLFQSFEWDATPLGDVNQRLHQQYEQVRSSKPSADLRFLRLPIGAPCKTSGYPAQAYSPQTDARLSNQSIAKQRRRNDGKSRIQDILPEDRARQRFANDTNDLEAISAIDWLAVIHADGNGLGQIFQRFHHHINATTAADNRNYIDTLKKFSIGLDICTESAFVNALSQVRIFSLPPSVSTTDGKTHLIPLAPLILGGDDLTVVCEGRTALPFTEKFLSAFEQATTASYPDVGDIVAQIAKAALGVGRLSACAGVAITKLHFPFSVAYALAEDLMASAKQVKKQVTHHHQGQTTPYPCSALDFHIVYDASDVTLDRIRTKQTLPQNLRLYRRPYVATPPNQLARAQQGRQWAEFHCWQTLQDKINELRARDDDGRRVLPNSQVHGLRVALYQGQSVADARYGLVRDRCSDAAREKLLTVAGDYDSLFQPEPEIAAPEHTESEGQTLCTTALIDALDAAEFMGEEVTPIDI